MLVRLLPGDPVKKIIPYGTDVKAQRAQLRKEIGLDQPLPQQYASWLGDLLHGDFGKIYPSRTPVSDVLASAAPVTLQLILYAQVLALLVAIPLGVLTAYRAGMWLDKIANASAFGLLSIPSFVARALPRVLRRRQAPVVAGRAVRPLRRRPRRALSLHGVAHDRARRRPDRDLHAAAAQRHDRHAAGELHQDARSKGISEPANPLAPRVPRLRA